MNIHHLKYFYEAARLRSVSKAAELNRVGQPAVSKAIRGLEAELDVKLIRHQRNRFHLTEEGLRIFEHCQEVFKSVERLKDSAGAHSSITGEIHLACQSSMTESLFFCKTMRELTNKYPQLKIHLHLGRTDLVKSWLANGSIDFGIVINNRNFSEFDREFIFSGQFHLIRSSSVACDWKKRGVITTEETKEVVHLEDRFFQKNGKILSKQMVVGSWSAIKNLVLQGVGVGFVPDYLVWEEVHLGKIKYVERSNYSIPYEVALLLPKTKFISAKVQTVAKYFCQWPKNQEMSSHRQSKDR